MATWREIFGSEQRKLPRNATPDARGAATKRASRIYRGLDPAPARSGKRRTRRTRRNPGGGTLAKAGLLAGAGYLGWKLLGQHQTPPAPSAPAMPPVLG